jgi:hypothetical protein
MVKLAPSSGVNVDLDALSDEEDTKGLRRELLPDISCKEEEYGEYKKNATAKRDDDDDEDEDDDNDDHHHHPHHTTNCGFSLESFQKERHLSRFDVPGGGLCFPVAVASALAGTIISKATAEKEPYKLDYSLLFPQGSPACVIAHALGSDIISTGLRTFSDEIATAVVARSGDLGDLRSSLFADIPSTFDGYPKISNHDDVAFYCERRSALINSQDPKRNIPKKKDEYDSPWGPGLAEVDCYAIAAVLRSSLFLVCNSNECRHYYWEKGRLNLDALDLVANDDMTPGERDIVLLLNNDHFNFLVVEKPTTLDTRVSLLHLHHFICKIGRPISDTQDGLDENTRPLSLAGRAGSHQRPSGHS